MKITQNTWQISLDEGKKGKPIMLIKNYDLEVFTPPCEPGAERFSAIGHLTVDISACFPYLNATLRGAVYHPTAKALTWKKAGHNIAFNAYNIAIGNAEDRDGAEKELKGLIDLVNRTWDRRDQITPSTEVRRRPTPMQVYRLLPGTNCTECGDATCWIFAAKLALSQKEPADCPLLSEPQHAERLAALEAIIIQAPAIK